MKKDFPIFDCDSHVVEPPEIWDEYVPSDRRAWVKTQFHFHTDTDQLRINGRVVPATRERSNAAEVGWPRWNKKAVGALVPGTEPWQQQFGRLAGCRDPQARLRDMDAIGTDQVMLFPTWFVRLALVRDPEAAGILARAYNDWVYDYCAADRRRLFPCAVLPIQSVERSIDELRRAAKRGFKAAAVRPCFWGGRYPTMPEFDPLWREFEDLGMVLAMHTFPSREALTPEWAERIARTRGSGDGLLFTDEAVVYSPGQFLSNIVFSMEPSIDASEALGFIFER
jgi:predicted TIM-barrel fold metal-dependent hydrolase